MLARYGRSEATTPKIMSIWHTPAIWLACTSGALSARTFRLSTPAARSSGRPHRSTHSSGREMNARTACFVSISITTTDRWWCFAAVSIRVRLLFPSGVVAHRSVPRGFRSDERKHVFMREPKAKRKTAKDFHWFCAREQGATGSWDPEECRARARGPCTTPCAPPCPVPNHRRLPFQLVARSESFTVP